MLNSGKWPAYEAQQCDMYFYADADLWCRCLQTLLRYCMGLLYVNFKFIWEGAMNVLRLEAEHAPDAFWALFIDRVRHAAALTHTTRIVEGT